MQDGTRDSAVGTRPTVTPFEHRTPEARVIRGEVFEPQRVLATVLVVHGFKGFAHWGFFPLLGQHLAAAGIRAITFDLSGSGIGEDRESFGALERFRENSYTRELEDIASVEALALERGWIGRRYGLLGHSRGGGMSILHASQSARVGALVTWAAISHVDRWSASDVARWREAGELPVVNARTGQVMPMGLGMLEDVEANAGGTLDIRAAASRVRVPWLLIHGDADESVPAEEARELHTASGARARLLLVAGAGHTFGATHPLGDVPPTLERIVSESVEFLRTALA